MAESKQGQGGQGNKGGSQSGNKGGNQGGSKSGTQGGDTSNRGFESMDEEEHRKIATKGGKAVSEDREHMAGIGKKGGAHSHDNDDKDNRTSGKK